MENRVKRIKKIYKIFYCLITMEFVDIARIMQVKEITQKETGFFDMPIIIQLIVTAFLMSPIITYLTHFVLIIYFKIFNKEYEDVDMIIKDIKYDIDSMSIIWGLLTITTIPVLMIIGWIAAIGL